jgi:hypothetical protein
MNESCIHEPQVRHAAIEDRWTDALRQHLKECAECSVAAAVTPFMTAFARPEARRRPLPDPAVIWLKARLWRGTAVAERAARPLNIIQMISYGVIAAGWAGLMNWKWSDIQQWLFGALSGVQPVTPVPVILGFVVLSSLTVMLGLHAILAEE